jgi:transcriptional regulator with XRE-family HTH domain
MGQKYLSVHTEKIMLGKEVRTLRENKKISYRQITLHTGVERNQIQKIEEAEGYMIDTYLLVIKFLKHGQSKFRPLTNGGDNA